MSDQSERTDLGTYDGLPSPSITAPHGLLLRRTGKSVVRRAVVTTGFIRGLLRCLVTLWLAGAVVDASAKELTIVAFGDSTTATRNTVEQVYADRLPALLRARGIEAKVINAGVGGSHTGRLSDNARHRRKHALDRLDEAVRNHKPDVVLVQFGWNDSWVDSDEPDGPSRIPVKDYAANLKHIAETLKQDGSQVILMTPNRPNTSVEQWRAARTQQYVDAVRKLATEDSLSLVDVWAEYERFNAAHGLSSDDLLLDSVHPNDKGHELVARLLSDPIGDLNASRKQRPNVLFIAVDDLRPELGCYGHDFVKSPNIDRLASEGVLFERAYCQQPLCNPSRTSLMTGMRPESTGVLGNHVYFRSRDPFIATLPQHFRNHGYTSVGIGKLYHGPFVDDAVCSTWDRLDDPLSWSEPAIRFGPRYYFTDQGIAAARKVFDARNPDADHDAWQNALLFGPMTETPDVPDNSLYDGKVGDAAVAKLREFKATGKPFFVGVGFIKPHTPFVAPKKYWDLYDPTAIPLAKNPDYPETSPEIGFHSSGEIRRYTDQPRRDPFTEENRRRLKHGYLACISHIDAQVGRVLDELDRLKLADNTIVVLWGDHGYHLGEQNMWGKVTSFENAARVPLIVRAPHVAESLRGSSSASERPTYLSASRTTKALVELVDLYPTLVDLAGLRPPEQLEGISFRAVLDQPGRQWKDAVFTDQPARGNWDQGGSVVGRSMRTDRYRYTAWVNRSDGSVVARQLFDHETDPLETNNLAADSRPRNQELVERLQRKLTAGWRGATGPALAFAAPNTAAASGPPEAGTPGIRAGFESFAAGPFTKLSDASGTWEAAEGHAVIHTAHSRGGIQSLRLPGGKERQVIWTPTSLPVRRTSQSVETTPQASTRRTGKSVVQNLEARPDRLSFWFERWTRRTPWDFRVEALVGGEWQTLHHDTSRAVTGSFRNRLSLNLGDIVPTKFRFTCTAPEKSGVMIDDLRLGRGEYREPVPTETPTRKVDGRVEIDLFYNRMNGAANYRIPSLTVTTKGTVLAVCDCRRDRGGDAPNNIDQVIRRSTDNGKTWSDVRPIVDFPGKRAAGDPSLTVDRETGTIWLCYVYANEGVGLAGGRNEPGYGDDTFHIHLRRSDDDGLTWSDPIDISRQIKPPEWHAIWTAPGIGIQTRDGRLMICFSGRKRLPDGKWTATSNIAYSDDHGKTWSSFKELGLGTNESQVVELDDGSYMINMRQNGGRARWVSISKDRGKTWSKQEQHSTLIEPGGCQASLLRLTSKSNGDDRNRLLFCNPASTNGRKNMTVRLSYDEGKTWPVEKVMYAGSSAYSCMTVLPDGSIGLLYERDGRRVTFTSFTLEWLTDGKDKRNQNDN